ncbi:hypothetical protein LDENG_00086880 [Lucifuga dentata]|nr:hypothetical protein LDENG_00086880 [Lucifuga dentata]
MDYSQNKLMPHIAAFLAKANSHRMVSESLYWKKETQFYNTTQYNTIQHNTIQYDIILYNNFIVHPVASKAFSAGLEIVRIIKLCFYNLIYILLMLYVFYKVCSHQFCY